MMPKSVSLVAILLLCFPAWVSAETLELFSPMDWQVVQRNDRNTGSVFVQGVLESSDASLDTVLIRFSDGSGESHWARFEAEIQGASFKGKMELPAGGWYKVEVRALANETLIAESVVEHVGVGEVFVITGQSNSANHGEVKQETRTGLVSSFAGDSWQLAVDPQPGGSGKGGSMMPPFGDSMAERFGVPVGIVACGVGASSVREWLPAGSRFPNPPTIEKRVMQVSENEWASDGDVFEKFTERLKPLGPDGFRAVLWHQGESDANQKDPTRTLRGDLYEEYLATLIRETGQEIGWSPPWFVAQASYHSPEDRGSPDIRAAQKALWTAGLALEGPDTDQLFGSNRGRDGQGVHFSDEGLRVHAARWVEKLEPWLKDELTRR